MYSKIYKSMTTDEIERLLNLYDDNSRQMVRVNDQQSDLIFSLIRTINLFRELNVSSANVQRSSRELHDYLCEMDNKYDPFMAKPIDDICEDDRFVPCNVTDHPEKEEES